MVTKLKLTTVGSSVGVVIPKDLLARMRVQKGDLLHVLEMPDGIMLKPYDPELEHQLEVAEGVMRDYRDTLRRLAG